MEETAKLQPASAGKGPLGWLRNLVTFCQIKKLEYQLHQSQKFQNYCVENQFRSLAELEGETGEQIRLKISELKKQL